MTRGLDGRYLPADSSEMKRLRAEGLSAREIGARVGMSRNAVIGRLWRATEREPPPPAWAPPEPKGCRWVEGEPRGKPGWEWCGAPIAAGGGWWCAAHRKRVYVAFKPGTRF